MTVSALGGRSSCRPFDIIGWFHVVVTLYFVFARHRLNSGWAGRAVLRLLAADTVSDRKNGARRGLTFWKYFAVLYPVSAGQLFNLLRDRLVWKIQISLFKKIPINKTDTSIMKDCYKRLFKKKLFLMWVFICKLTLHKAYKLILITPCIMARLEDEIKWLSL